MEQQDVVLAEDDLCYTEHGRMLALLCDGMGGMQSGGVASQLAAESTFAAFRALPEEASVLAFLDEALTRADEAVSALHYADGRPLESGTTFLAVVIEDGKLYLANVGDSHCYLIRDGQLRLLSREHNLMALLLEDVANGELTLEEARSHPRRDALTSYIGMGGLRFRQLPDPPFPLRAGDEILLCSDGLYRSLSEREILETVLRAGRDVRSAADALTARAVGKELPDQDNTSALLLRYDDAAVDPPRQLALRKRRAAAPKRAYRAKAGAGPAITVLSGTLRGSVFSLREDEAVLVGTDAEKCTVLLPSEYRYVSRVHCSVRCAANGKYYVTDSSLNGSYTAERRRLPRGKSVALAPGTVLHLAGGDCLLRLG